MSIETARTCPAPDQSKPASNLRNKSADSVFATAPAQQVFVEQIIDPNLNIKTFRVGNFGFADYIFEVPPNKLSYQTRIDLRDSLGIYLDFFATVDIKNRKL